MQQSLQKQFLQKESAPELSGPMNTPIKYEVFYIYFIYSF